MSGCAKVKMRAEVDQREKESWGGPPSEKLPHQYVCPHVRLMGS